MAINNELTERIEWISKLIHLILVKLSSAAAIISPLSITCVNYFIYDMGDDSFFFDATLWFPFDESKPLGFFMALLFQCFAVFTILSCLTPIVCIYIGTCWSIEVFLVDIARDISDLKKKKLLEWNEQKLSERVCNFVRFHADVEEFSEYFSSARTVMNIENINFFQIDRQV